MIAFIDLDFPFSQCDLQAFGLKKWRNTSPDTQSDGLFSQTHDTKVSTLTKLKSWHSTESIKLLFAFMCILLSLY